MTGLAGLHGPRLAPPPDGLDLALVTGRHRLRRRRITSAAAMTTSLALLAFASLSRGSTSTLDRLEPAATTPPPAVTTTAPGTSSSTEHGHPVAAPTAGVPTVAGDVPTPGPSSLTSSRTPQPGPDDRRWVGHASRDIRVHMDGDDTACVPVNFAAQVAGTGFCYWLEGPADTVPGKVSVLRYTLCLGPHQSDSTLVFETAEELAIVVRGVGGEVLWRLGAPGREDEHAVRFTHGECRSWTVEWNGEDADGYALPRGSYEVAATLTVLNAARPKPWPPERTVSTTVR